MACTTVNNLKLVNCTVYLALRDADGNPGALQDVGDAPMFDFGATSTFAENYNSRGRFKVRDISFVNQIDANAKLSLKEATLSNLALVTYGQKTTRTGDTTTAEPFTRTGIVAGEKDLLPLLPSKVTSVSIRDSAGSPATLAATTNYTLDADNGIITWVNVTGFTQPFKATYTQPNRTIVSFARNAAAANEYYLVIVGENAAKGYEKTKVTLFRTRIKPTTVTLVDTESNDASGKYEVELDALADLCRSSADADPLGQFGTIEYLG